jgi:dTDP-4-dehydrorhamnose reductase
LKNIFILGADGFIGTALAKVLSKNNNVYGSTRSSHAKNLYAVMYECFNPLDNYSIKDIVKKRSIDIVINCIAMANVDDCEKNIIQAEDINVGLVKSLTDLSVSQGFKLVHLSSNAVYSGDSPLYSEDELREPKNIYGKLKSAADKYIETNCSNYLIARVMTVFGNNEKYHRTNPAKFIVDRLALGESTYLVNDVYNNLLYINDLTYALDKLIELDQQGTFNISGDEVVNRFEFGLLISKALSLNENLIIECDSSKFGVLANRAANTSFNNNKIKSVIDFRPTPLIDAILKGFL